MNPLQTLIVRGKTLLAGEDGYPCVIGPGGITADKREGDGKTPIGSFPLRWCYYRPDKFAVPPDTQLPLIVLTPNDGWCEDPNHPLYNQPVTLPFEARHEKLWRDDEIYDLVITLGYNDDPAVPGKGSCIFLHLMRDDGSPTQGCVALQRADLLTLLPRLSTQTVLVVEG